MSDEYFKAAELEKSNHGPNPPTFYNGWDAACRWAREWFTSKKHDLELSYCFVMNEKYDKLRTENARLRDALEKTITAFKQTSGLTTTQQYQFLSDIEQALTKSTEKWGDTNQQEQE